MAYYEPYKYLDYNIPADGCPQFWTYKKVSFVTSLILIFLLMTLSLRPWTFVFLSMVAASLTMSFDDEGAFSDYFWRLIIIVALVFFFRFLIWCAQMVKRLRNRSINGREDVDEDEINEDDESISVYVSLGLIAILALVLTWRVQKLQRSRRRRRIGVFD